MYGAKSHWATLKSKTKNSMDNMLIDPSKLKITAKKSVETAMSKTSVPIIDNRSFRRFIIPISVS
jgi:hypothetical protein